MPARFRVASALTAFFFLWNAVIVPLRAEEAIPVTSLAGFRSSGTDLETQFRQVLWDRLKDLDRFKLVSDSIVNTQVGEMWSAEQKESSEVLDEAYKNYVKGKKQYENLDIDEAIKSLNAAVKGYREGIGALRENKYLLASHLYLGMALVIRGSVAEGKEYIRQMIVLDPGRVGHRPPAAVFPPKIVNLHQELTQEVLKGTTGAVSIRIKPLGATIYLDGVEQGPSPVDIRNVPAGEHYIIAEKKGFSRFSKPLVVVAGNNLVDGRLEEWSLVSPFPFAMRGQESITDPLVKLGDDLNSHILVLGKITDPAGDRASAAAQIFDVRSKEFSKIEAVALDRKRVKKSAEELAKKLLADVTIDGLVIPQLKPELEAFPVTAEPGGPKSVLIIVPSPFYETWWFWTIVGVAVAGGTAGIFLLRSTPDYHVVNVGNPLQ